MTKPKQSKFAEARFTAQEALQFHSQGKPGKLEITTTKPLATQRDLSLAYSPGVAEPVRAIAENPASVYDYTNKGNLVAVISNGTAILGLGNLGALASKPVMEGKGALFKRFADIDGIDVLVSTEDPEAFINCVRYLGPSFGGINLEDIKSPDCFIIEDRLKELLDIPVFHDDQHGTAICVAAGMINGLRVVGKDIADVKLVCCGAGAAALACLNLLVSIGMKRENITIADIKGVVYKGRAAGMTPQKEKLAAATSKRTLAEAIEGADVFVGLSVANCVTPDMVRRMAPKSVIFAMANPTPEIFPADALAAGVAVVGTGRTDFPNQVNNVLGFPGIFRGALDVRARDINEEMKRAASAALSELACEEIPAEVRAFLARAYPEDTRKGVFDGRNPLKESYVIPKPFDPRVVPRVARKVAEAAMATGVSRLRIDNLDAYEASVTARVRAKLETRMAAKK